MALLKSLPKQLRKSFVPVPDYADACLKAMEPTDKPLTRMLSEQLMNMTGVYIPEDAWQEESVDDHLRMNFRVLDQNGQQVGAGRDLLALKRSHGNQGSAQFHQSTDTGLEREGVIDWDFGALPKSIQLDRGGIQLPGFPSLVESKDGVAVRIVDSEAECQNGS